MYMYEFSLICLLITISHMYCLGVTQKPTIYNLICYREKNFDTILSICTTNFFGVIFPAVFQMTTIWTGKLAIKTLLVSLTNNYTLFCMTYPSAHHTSPSYDTGLEPRVWADSSSPQYRTPLYTGSILNHYIRADRNIGSYPTVSSYFCCRILRLKQNIITLYSVLKQ